MPKQFQSAKYKRTMFKGKTTNELYEACLNSGLCEEHYAEVKELGEEAMFESKNAQKQALLYIRLHILDPILFGRPYNPEKMKVLFETAGYFSIKENPAIDNEEFVERIRMLDSVIVFFLCKLSEVCCSGVFFKSTRKPRTNTNTENHFSKLLAAKSLDEKDVGCFNLCLKENFPSCDEGLIKVSYVATLLYVRNVTINVNLRNAIEQVEQDSVDLLEEGKQWNYIGNDAFKRLKWDEAIDAFSKALNFNPYNVCLHTTRARSYSKQNRINNAILDYYIAVMIHPSYFEAYYHWASILFDLSRYEECITITDYGLHYNEQYQSSTAYKTLQRLRNSAVNALNEANSKVIEGKDAESTMEQFDDPEKEDLPDLIEASDSDIEIQDVPELVEASDDSTESESEPELVESKMQLFAFNISSTDHESEKRKKKEPPKTNKPHPCLQNDDEARAKSLQIALKEASQTLIDGSGLLAMRRFKDVLDEMKASPEIYNYEECDIICIKYAYAFACYKSGGYDDLNKAISEFKEITEDKSVIFPAAYYCIALAYHKLNRFKQALDYLRKIDDMIQKGIHSRVYVWPGLVTVIDETRLDYLKSLLPDIIKECENPPSPNAICRSKNCDLLQTIYFSDPNFKGFFSIQCSEQCCLQYHPQCWKIIKYTYNVTDKESLEHKCFTPDCEGSIIKIQSITKDGTVGKEFSVPEQKKPVKPKKSKLEKKLEIKEEKKRRRKDSARHDSTSEVPEEITNEKTSELECEASNKEKISQTKIEAKDTNGISSIHNTSQLSVNAEPFIVLKKEKNSSDMTIKVPMKAKEHKKFKNNTFTFNEFLQHSDASVNGDNSVPETSFANKGNLEVSSTLLQANIFELSKTEESHSDDLNFDFEFTKPSISATECIKKNIYSYFKEILGKCGPMRIDDPDLLKKINSFPEEAKILEDYGGIGKFLEQNLEFAFVCGSYICLVDQLPLAYQKANAEPLQATNIKVSEHFQTFDSSDEKSIDLFRFSCLNPDALEYRPGTSSDTMSRSRSENSITKKERMFQRVHDLLSTANIKKCFTATDKEVVEPLLQQNVCEAPSQSRRASVSSTNSCSQNLSDTEFSIPEGEVLELVSKCTEAVKFYFSEESKEYRYYIDLCLKPYSIVKKPRKISKSIQTENIEVEKVCRGTMKVDVELQEQKELVNSLQEEKDNLYALKVQLEEQCNAAFDSATKFQKKSNVEIANLRKEVEDSRIALEEQQKEFRIKENKLDKEVKVLTESLKKRNDEYLNLKREKEKALSVGERLDDENMKKLEIGKAAAEKRAKTSELQLLHITKTEFLKRIGIKKTEASSKMQEIQDGITLFSASLSPLAASNYTVLLTQIRNYTALLDGIQKKFISHIEELINEVNNGAQLSQLEPFDVPELPEIPTWNVQQMSNMLNPQASPWTSDMMNNSLYNTAAFNPFSFTPSTTIPSPKPSVPVAQQISHANAQQMPTTSLEGNSFNYAIVQTNNQSNKSEASVLKAPPGLHPNASSVTSAQKHSSVLQSTVTNGKTRNTNETLNSALSINLTSTAEKVAATNSGSSIKKIDSPTLELDYNAKRKELRTNAIFKPKLDAVISRPSTAMEKTVPSGSKSAGKDLKRSFEKLISKLQGQFPTLSQIEIINCVKEFRDQRESGLSGLTVEKIISSVSAIIEAKQKRSSANQILDSGVKGVAAKMSNAILVNKKLVPESKPREPVQDTFVKKSAWGATDSSGANKHWSGSSIEDDCIICYEKMTQHTAYKVLCGHRFHFKCIKEWLDKKSDCPICRVHLLLPEDYPALS
ncbi:e3 ubiquitin-protein ligase DZIP3 [Caerostris darwini]|uniref:E3 ubiquitin-protein ligase DZIP3 n=1 Tax=Caerostris darwini TaxID=1538125 RepID=A0AAV4MIH3_9ARAC|nr:e3 ubiquitin-protein ligase DZIP3 [Caerostris darwini]